MIGTFFTCFIFFLGLAIGYLLAKLRIFEILVDALIPLKSAGGPSIFDFFKLMREESEVIFAKDPAIKCSLELFLYPSVYAIVLHRYSHSLYLRKKFFIARLISQLARSLTGIEIHPGAKLGKRVFFDHGNFINK
jgi:hypothetical protein